MKPEPISNLDAAILNVEDPTAPDTMGILLLFDGHIDEELLYERIRAAWLKYPRYRQRIRRRPFGRMEWVEDPTFDIRVHVRRVAVPAPNDVHALRQTVGDLMSHLLDRSKPLWSMHIIEGGPGGDALLIRVHHAIGDGVTLMTTALGLFRDRFIPDTKKKRGSLLSRVMGPINEVVGVTQSVNAWMRQAQETGLGDALRARAGEALELGVKLFPLIQDPPTILTGKLSRRKSVSWTPPVPAREFKRLARAFDVTSNDLALALITGALRRYFILRSEPVPPVLHASVPVYLSETFEVGNNFGLVLAPLPLGEADPRVRVSKVHEAMERLKKSPEAEIVAGVFALSGQLPPGVVARLFEEVTRKASLVVTNVPGPPIQIELAGATLEHVVPIVPLSGHIGLGIAIASYNRQLSLGIQADGDRMQPNIRAFVDLVRAELALLTSLADDENQSERHQCIAQTLSGQRCRNRARLGMHTCYVHRQFEAGTEEV